MCQRVPLKLYAGVIHDRTGRPLAVLMGEAGSRRMIFNRNGAGRQSPTPGDICAARTSFLNFIGEIAVVRIKVHPLFVYYLAIHLYTGLLCALSHCKKPQTFNLRTLYMLPRHSGLNLDGPINTTLNRPFISGERGGARLPLILNSRPSHARKCFRGRLQVMAGLTIDKAR